jgi:hypothetical protein
LKKTKEQKSVGRGEGDAKNRKVKDLEQQIEKLQAEQSDLKIQTNRQKELKEGKKFEPSEKKETDDVKGETNENVSDKDILNSKLQEKINDLKKLQNERSRDPKRLQKITTLKKDIEELTNSVHANDFDESSLFNLPIKQKNFSYQPSVSPNFNSGKFVFLPENEKITSFNDKGPINDTFNQLNKNIERLTERMLGISNDISLLASKQQNINNNQPATIINNSSTTQSPNKLDISSARDENFLARFDYIRNNSYNRVSY